MSVLSDLVKAGVVVNGSAGVDLDATMAKVKAQLAAEIESQAGQDAKIEAMLDSLFDGVEPGTPIPTDAVVGEIANALAGGNILAVKSAGDAVHAYLSRSSRFVGKRGRNGGLTRLSK